ncbi:MAG: holo-ACP synthase [Oceanicaulis sp.]
MIVGIGSDLIDIRRIERSVERFGDRFLNRVFTEGERAKAESRRRSVDTYAKRFAAKEACAKALGTGIYRGVTWKQMEVINLRGGKPTLKLTGAAAERLAELAPAPLQTRIHVTLTDDHPWAQAFVVIEALDPS